MPDENEAREQAEIEAERAEEEAFEAQFPPERFEGVADALGLPPDPEAFSALRRVLLPEFRFFVENCSGAKLTREDRIARMEKLRDAANALHCSLGSGGARLLLPRAMWGPERVNDQFHATLRELAKEADAQIKRLRSSRSRGGRPVKGALRQLSKDLIRVYEQITGETAGKPYWLPDKRTYGGAFYLFACAVRNCLWDCLPEVRTILSPSCGALAEQLRNHWPKDDTEAG